MTEKRLPIRILVVEDDPADALLLQEALNRVSGASFTTTRLESLEDALAHLAATPFDVVLLDLGLTDSKGPDTVIRFRRHAPQVPVVVLTGLDDEAVGIKAVQLGAQDYLVKGRYPVALLGRAVLYAIERHQTAMALRDSEARLSGLINSAIDAIITLDSHGRITLFNPAAQQMFGYKAKEVLGKMLDMLVPERFRSAGRGDVKSPAHPDQYVKAPARGDAKAPLHHLFGQIDFRARKTSALSLIYGLRADGAEFPMEVSISQVRVMGKKLFTAILRDVTERQRDEEARKLAEESLRQAQRLESIGLLAGGIAHDFNNILTAVKGNLSLALAELSPKCEVRDHLEVVVESIERAATLTRQLLAYAGKGASVRTRVSVTEVAERAVQMLQTSTPRTIKLRADLAPNLPPVVMDPSQLELIFINLIVNGIEAIAEKQTGSVAVSTGRSDDFLCLAVADTGSGMDRVTQARMFEPFFTTKFMGRGLGLAAVDGIVRSLDGRISVESAVGQGTLITILLPITDLLVPRDAKEPLRTSGELLPRLPDPNVSTPT